MGAAVNSADDEGGQDRDESQDMHEHLFVELSFGTKVPIWPMSFDARFGRPARRERARVPEMKIAPPGLKPAGR